MSERKKRKLTGILYNNFEKRGIIDQFTDLCAILKGNQAFASKQGWS
jgi:hypothetical protein